MKKWLAGLCAGLVVASTAWGQPLRILFVGNSFTYTRPPALQYNADAVEDMNYANFLANPEGSDPALPQPWGGVAGIFKALADQAGQDWLVSHSLRGGATLRGHYLNTNPANWDLRANLAARKWDVVVIQGNSTEALPAPEGNPPQFSAYVTKLERYVRVGAAEQYRESQLFPGGSNALRTIPANPNANADAAVYLYQTWARPDMVYPAGAFYAGRGLEAMTEDIRQAYGAAAMANGQITGIAPVGEAFQRAVDTGVALANPYEPTRGVDLWWHEDQFHPNQYGAYLSALVLFGSVTRVDPASFGAAERAASDLGIAPLHALQLQGVASQQLRASGYALTTVACLNAAPSAPLPEACLEGSAKATP
jgi:hypothetical protein